VEFVPSEKNLDPKWHPEQVDIMDWATNIKVIRGGSVCVRVRVCVRMSVGVGLVDWSVNQGDERGMVCLRAFVCVCVCVCARVCVWTSWAINQGR